MAGKLQPCIICGTEYEVCRNCPDTTLNTPWRKLCDTPVHYQVYLIIQDIQGGRLTGDEAKQCLDRIGITQNDLVNMLPSVQSILNPVFMNTEMTKVEDEIQPETKNDIEEESMEVEEDK